MSYYQIAAGLDAATRDPLARSIVLDIDSPGGEAAGAAELAQVVRETDAKKPVVAFVDGLATSGAYLIAAGAREIVAAPSAMLGSIGVVMLHMDASAALKGMGLKPTLLHAGAFKIDGSPYHALKSDEQGRLQAILDGLYDLQLQTIGSLRPKLGAAGARATEAGVYVGAGAVKAGLADRIGTRFLAGKPTVAAAIQKGNSMTRNPTAAAPAPSAESEYERGEKAFAALYGRPDATAKRAPVAIVPSPFPPSSGAAFDVAEYKRGAAAFTALFRK